MLEGNKFSFDGTVRYSELDCEGSLSIGGMINYMQDCSTFHSEALGLGVDYLKKIERAWLLSAYNVDILKPVRHKQKIKISTWASEFKLIYGDRNFMIEDESGPAALARTLWIYVDTKTRRPVKPPQAEIDAYGTAPPLEMEPAARKLKTPDDMIEAEPFRVGKFCRDTNGHMNNSWYVIFSMEFLPADFKIKNMKVVFQKEVVPGDIVYPFVKLADGKAAVVFKDEKGMTHSTVLFFE